MGLYSSKATRSAIYANSTLLYPYKDTRLDTIYNLQFCDNDSLLHSEYRPTGILAQLLNEDVSDEILQTLAMNGDEDTHSYAGVCTVAQE